MWVYLMTRVGCTICDIHVFIDVISSNVVCVRHKDLVNSKGMSLAQIFADMLCLLSSKSGPFLINDLLPGLQQK